jgi:hypothetical protein
MTTDGNIMGNDPVIREKLQALVGQTGQQLALLNLIHGKIGLLSRNVDKTEEIKMPKDILELLNTLRRNCINIDAKIESINRIL